MTEETTPITDEAEISLRVTCLNLVQHLCPDAQSMARDAKVLVDFCHGVEASEPATG